jgi:hypothetical protein
VEHHLTGHETEPWELVYFKPHKSQLPVVEQAVETAALRHCGRGPSSYETSRQIREAFPSGALHATSDWIEIYLRLDLT